MTVNSSSLSCGSIRHKSIVLIVIAILIALSLCVGLMVPQTAHAAATEVTKLDKMQVAVSLEGTSTTVMAVTVAVPANISLPCSVPIVLPMGYSLIQQGEFDTSPSSPTATTNAVASNANSKTITYTFTLNKSHNFFFAASTSSSIYNSSAMGSGGAMLAAFDVTAATDIADLIVGIAPPSTGMIGAGGSSMKTFSAGTDSAGNDIKLYGQDFTNVKKGDMKTVQVAFAPQSQAEQDAAAQKQQNSSASSVNNFLSQPLVWVLSALLIIVIIILITVIMRQRQSAAGDEEDEDEVDADTDEDEANEEDGEPDSDDEFDPFADASDTKDEVAGEEHTAKTSDS